MPNLTVCAGCGDDEAFRFSYSEGCLFCLNCFGDAKDTTVLNPTVLAAMRHIIYSDFSKIYSFEIPKKDAELLSLITEKYVSVQSEYKFKTLDFYKSVKEPTI